MHINKHKIITIINILFVLLIISAFVIGLAKTVFKPYEVNRYENRACNKISKPTLSAILDNSFQNSLEAAFADQLPKAPALKKAYNDILSNYLSIFLKPIIESHDRTYISYNDMLIFGKMYMYKPRNPDDELTALQERADSYNTLFDKHPDLDFYVYYIEEDTDINFETNKKLNTDDYFFSLLNLPEEKTASFEINSFNEYKEYFYKTDHHWNHKGSYKAYTEIVDFLNCEGEEIKNGDEVFISDDFIGSKGAKVGSELIKDRFLAYDFSYAEPVITINGEIVKDYGSQSAFIAGKTTQALSYGSFYGYDKGEVILDTNDSDKDNILIIGDSYDNAIMKLLASHFNKTFSVDLRHYEKHKGEKFNFSEYIEDNNIDKVLFIGHITYFTLNTFTPET